VEKIPVPIMRPTLAYVVTSIWAGKEVKDVHQHRTQERPKEWNERNPTVFLRIPLKKTNRHTAIMSGYRTVDLRTSKTRGVCCMQFQLLHGRKRLSDAALWISTILQTRLELETKRQKSKKAYHRAQPTPSHPHEFQLNLAASK
jgi:hypothetical protein